jgi:hypothetical protein
MLGLPVKFDFAQRGLVSFRVGDKEPTRIRGRRRMKPSIWCEVADHSTAMAALAARMTDERARRRIVVWLTEAGKSGAGAYPACWATRLCSLWYGGTRPRSAIIW